MISVVVKKTFDKIAPSFHIESLILGLKEDCFKMIDY